MRHWVRLVFVFCFLGFSPLASAGQFEDGLAAGRSGDSATALKLWRPLAEQGHVLAQHNMGFMYSKGFGVPKDLKEAVKWYRKAGEGGAVESQSVLGAMYGLGNEVTQDYAEAVKWFRLAARQEHARSQLILAGHYYLGNGVPADKAQALKWYILASLSSDIEIAKKAAATGADIEEEMTSAQLKRAQEMAEACVKSNYAQCD